ncbi:MAG: phage terminase small subunit [Brevundimonas sp.]|uniref:phage terminase small subunit n=1 Tax=Brevundimonas sp. TaxID=1871086 RepID=UPI00391B7AFA
MSLFKRVQERKAAGEAFDHAAARARASEAQAATAAAEEAAAPASEAPAPVLATPRPTIFRNHRLRVMAASGSRVLAATGVRAPTRAGNDNAEPQSVEEAEIRILLIDHKRSLKAIQSREQKIALKRELLPQYAAWCDGVLSADTGAYDEVFATIMIWRIDVGDYFAALPQIDYVIRHKMELPAHIDRTPATFVTEEIAEAALRAFQLGPEEGKAFPAGILAAIEELVDSPVDELRCDMPDEVRAKLQKAIGLAVIAADDEDRNRLEEGLKRFQRALELDPKSGVKKTIDGLQRQLKKVTAPADATTQPPAPEGTG